MRFDVVTLFPELFGPHLALGVTRRAYRVAGPDRAPGHGPDASPEPAEPPPLAVHLWPLRDFATDAYRRVDDRPFGGGPGMVMLAEPLLRALDAVAAARAGPAAAVPGTAPVIHFTPTGRRLDQALVRDIAAGPGAVLLCGRYEGIDQRLLDRRVTLELSLGDFVLSGGEIPALALLDAVARLQQGVLTAGSHEQDSFSDGLLEGPHYSRPERLRLDGEELAVPEVLMSGHHARIERWRRERSLERTARRRPDLLAAARAAGRLSAQDERFLASLALPAPPMP
jgi:tRNA (guanine37-N1)-methyltransferase